ncbi:MAG: NADH-quinone oxidoreductase subunit H [Clostridia bacterium]|nr:NADH-quinone oxidoreductase subunit H [Clostridia bacterium]
MMEVVLIILGTILLAPLAGGLLTGVDRIITARMQGRQGPPLLQPFYDLIKLWRKEAQITNTLQVFYAVIYLVFAVLSLVLFVLGQNLLLIIFVLTIGSGAMVLGALSTPSPYSQIGANREILQMLAYDPILLITAVALYLVTGSFKLSEVVAYQTASGQPLLFVLPLVFLTMTYVLTIKMRKSPFDISASHHAHQEIVRGITTEYSGPYLALLEIAHWFEVVLVLGLVAIFWANSWLMALILVGAVFLLELLLDNITARLTYRWMLQSTWVVGMGLAVLNIAYLYLA